MAQIKLERIGKWGGGGDKKTEEYEDPSKRVQDFIKYAKISEFGLHELESTLNRKQNLRVA